MNITSIANLYTSLQTTSAKAVTTDPVQKGLEKASARIEGQIEATGVQLSAYGQVKSGFARVEDAGKTLAKTGNLSVADTKKALQSMVAAYNDTRSAAASTSPGNASNAANALRRAASADSMRADLQSLGITQKSDGSLSIDTKKLDQALASNPDSAKGVAARVGGQFQQNASRALSESGGINKTMNSLNTQNQQLESRQSNLQALSSAQLSSANSNSYAGIASYQRMFSM
jgi:flagellar hook-associated protein 2